MRLKKVAIAIKYGQEINTNLIISGHLVISKLRPGRFPLNPLSDKSRISCSSWWLEGPFSLIIRAILKAWYTIPMIRVKDILREILWVCLKLAQSYGKMDGILVNYQSLSTIPCIQWSSLQHTLYLWTPMGYMKWGYQFLIYDYKKISILYSIYFTDEVVENSGFIHHQITTIKL